MNSGDSSLEALNGDRLTGGLIHDVYDGIGLFGLYVRRLKAAGCFKCIKCRVALVREILRRSTRNVVST